MKTCHVMRIYVSEMEKLDGKPSYEALLSMVREKGLAGATVFRGMAGFGPHHVLHTEKILRLSDDLPVVVEVVDSPEVITSLSESVREILPDHLITVQEVSAL